MHRRTLYDDNLGVGEPINETGLNGEGLVIKGEQLIYLDDERNGTIHHRVTGEEMMLEPHFVFIRDEGNYKDWINKYVTKVSCKLLIFRCN